MAWPVVAPRWRTSWCYPEMPVRSPPRPPTPPCFDFMTGGGWINIGNSKANFGFNAGYKPNSATPEIHFNYIDHNSGMQMKATSISVYRTGDTATTRHMEGNAEINGVS